MKKKNMFLSGAIRFACIMLCIISVFGISFTVAAESDYGEIYDSYTYQTGYNSKKVIKTKPIYEAVKSITGEALSIGSLSAPKHLFVKGECLFLLDSDNGRIIELDENYNVKSIINNLNLNGESIDFTGAGGLYVSNVGDIYIADTSNSRIIVLNQNRQIKNIMLCPESELLDKEFRFAPSRITEDKNGYLYVLCDGCYYGAMIYSPEGEFIGFYGADTVETTVLSAIADFFTSLFDTEEKRNASVKKLPYQFNDICIDENDFIITVSNSKIRRLGPSGKNILNYRDGYKTVNAESYIFGDEDVVYDAKGLKTEQSFTGGTASGNYLYACDGLSGRIYMYDRELNLISVFGGGMGQGKQNGKFITAASIAVFGNDLLVSDAMKNSVTVFKLTDYGKLLTAANDLTLDGDYDKAEPLWRKVNELDKNCQLAYSGLAKAYILKEDYKTAMKYAEEGLDRVTYSKAFSQNMTEFLSRNFIWIFLAAVILIFALCFMIIYSKKHSVKLIKNKKLAICFSTLIHPFDAFGEMKYKKLTSVPIATVVLLLFYIGKAAENLNGGFMYKEDGNETFNSLLLIIGTVGIVLLGTIVNWGVCILFEGKGRMKEIYCGFCYSLLPQIVYSILFVILSNIVVPQGTTFVSILSTICMIYTVIILFVSICSIHEFSFFKALATGVITILGMAIVGFIIFMMLTLGQNFFGFIMGIIREVTLR